MNLLSLEKAEKLLELAEKGHSASWMEKVTGVSRGTVLSYRNCWLEEEVIPLNCPCGLPVNHPGRCAWRCKNEPKGPRAIVAQEPTFSPVMIDESPEPDPATDVESIMSDNILSFTHVSMPLPVRVPFCPLPYHPVVPPIEDKPIPKDPPEKPKPFRTEAEKKAIRNEKQRKWREKNKEKLQAKRREYYEKNGEREKQNARNRRKKNGYMNSKRNKQPAPTSEQIQQATEEYLAEGNLITATSAAASREV